MSLVVGTTTATLSVVQSQSKYNQPCATNSYAITYASSVSVGNWLVVAAEAGGTYNAIVTISDSHSNHFTVVEDFFTSGATQTLLEYAPITTGGTDTITIADNMGVADICSVGIYEVHASVSGTTITATGASGNWGGTSVSTSTSLTLNSGYFAVATCAGAGAPCDITTATSGFTILGTGDNGEYSTSGATSPTNFAATITSGPANWGLGGMVLTPINS